VNRNKGPLSVTILGCMYIAVGTVGFIYHSPEFQASHAFQYDLVWIELVRLLCR
jgi:hypothetical protein